MSKNDLLTRATHDILKAKLAADGATPASDWAINYEPLTSAARHLCSRISLVRSCRRRVLKIRVCLLTLLMVNPAERANRMTPPCDCFICISVLPDFETDWRLRKGNMEEDVICVLLAGH